MSRWIWRKPATRPCLAAHPKLLQRPIVSYRGSALIGRPPERLQTLLQAAARSS
jgi:arsenate reductase-like glutaredoxin family protein